MDNNYLTISKYRFEKAKDDLEASQILLRENKYAQSLNRSYYAIFHAVRSLLILDGFDSKKHSGIISTFIKDYVKTNILDVEYSKIIKSAQDIRHASDYDDFYIAYKIDAEDQVGNAAKFIAAIADYIKVSFNNNWEN